MSEKMSKNIVTVFYTHFCVCDDYALIRLLQLFSKTFFEKSKSDILKMSKMQVPNTLQNTFFLKSQIFL